MDLNEAHLQQQNVLARQRAAPAIQIDDPEAMKVIREAQASIARDKERYWMEEDEVLPMLNAADGSDDVFNHLRILNFAAMALRIVPASFFSRTPEKATIVFERPTWDRWLQSFDFIAQRMGYVKARKR